MQPPAIRPKENVMIPASAVPPRSSSTSANRTPAYAALPAPPTPSKSTTVMSNKSSTVSSWMRKAAAVFAPQQHPPRQQPKKSKRTSTPSKKRNSLEDDAGGDGFAEAVSAEDFAQAVGIHIVNRDMNSTTVGSGHSFAADPMPATPPSPLARHYMELNAATSPLPVRLPGPRLIPAPLNMMALFNGPPCSLSPVPASPSGGRSGHVRSPSVPSTPTKEVQPLEINQQTNLQRSRSQSISGPVSDLTGSSYSSSHRMVHVSNKGRFTLTREQSDYYTARHASPSLHRRSPSTVSVSRFHVVRSMDRPVLILEPSGSGDGQTLSSDTLKSNATSKSFDSGVHF